jgi:hypothetical protein
MAKKQFGSMTNPAPTEESKVLTISEVQETVEKLEPIEVEEKEPTIPLSQVSDLVEKMVQEQLAKIPLAQPQVQTDKKEETLIPKIMVNDIPELERFEVKDRIYVLSDNTKPISFSIRHQHTPNSPLNYTNKSTQEVHALRYATNQPSFFVDKQSKELGSVSVSHITFIDGMLKVPADNITLQKFLSIHADNPSVFKEFDPKEKSKEKEQEFNVLFKAMELAKNLDYIGKDAIARLICSDYMEDWDSSRVVSEIYDSLKVNPKKFILLAENPSLKVKGVAKTAVSRGIIKYSNFKFYNDKGEIILEVARNTDEYDAIADYFQSNAGRDLYEYIKGYIIK